MILNGLRLYNYLILSPGFEANYNPNDYSPKTDLKIIGKEKGTDYFIINFIRPYLLKDIDIIWKGLFDNFKIEYSDNFLIWNIIFDGNFYEKQEINKKIVFLKFTFENHNANFQIIQCSPNIEEILDTDRFISFRRHHLIPSKLISDDYLLNPFIQTYLRMLEKGNEKKKFCHLIPQFIIGSETNIYHGIGGIDTYAIDEVPIDEDWSREFNEQ